MQSYGRILEPLHPHYGVSLCGINTIKKFHTILAKGFGASQTWKKLVDIREDIEHNV